MPNSQKAWIVESRGRPEEVLKLRNDWPIPSPGTLDPGHVLVRIQAAALNPAGYKIMMMLPNLVTGRPLPTEYDFAGVVEDGGDTEYKPGDPVFGFLHPFLAARTKQGTLSEYIRISSDYIARRPSNVSPVEAAGVAIVAETAYEGIFDIGKLEAGQTILVNGGSSGIGAFAIQLAKAKGATVVATASAKNLEYLKKLGADQVIDYTKEPLHEYLTKNPPSPKFHLIYDAVGLVDPVLYLHSPAYLAPNGLFLSSGPMAGDTSFQQLWLMAKTIVFGFLIPRQLGGVPRKYWFHSMQHSKPRLEEIQKLLANGAINPVVDSVYEFDDALLAYKRMQSGRAAGKIVVKVDPTVN